MKRIIVITSFIIVFCFQLSSQTQEELDSLYAIDSSWIIYSDTINNNYDLALLFAADSGNVDRVLELLSKGANVNVTTTGGITSLMYSN